MSEYPGTPKQGLSCPRVISVSSPSDRANHPVVPGKDAAFLPQTSPKPSLQLHLPLVLTAAPSMFTQPDFPANQEYVQARGKIKYNLSQQSMKVNPNRHTSKGFLFATFITCAEGTIASKQFALLNETKTREAFLGKIILKNHQQPIQTFQTLILNKEM